MRESIKCIEPSLTRLQTKLSSELYHFPYAEKLSELWQEGIENSPNAEFDSDVSTEVQYLKTVGCVMRCDDPEQRQILLRTLHKYGVSEMMCMDSDREPSIRTPKLEQEPAHKARNDIPDHVFSEILFEHAKTEGWLLKFDVNRLSGAECTWECVMNVNKEDFAGTGRRKHHAQHAASKRACEHFGLG